MAEALLSVRDLVIDIDTPRGVLHAVRGVSFDVNRGETLCIVGESGCGKSMTALALMGLLPKQAKRRVSRLVFEGEDLTQSVAARLAALRGLRMAMIFQEPMTALNPAYTIGDQLCEVHRRHKRSSGAQARERAAELLEKVGITAVGERLEQYPHQLSGGTAPARDDRDGPDVRPRASDRRRAHHRARRDDPGADPAPPR